MSTPSESNLFEGARALLDTPELPDLGPRTRPGTLSRTTLDDRFATMFAQNPAAERVQQLIRGTLLLWHDHLDAAHSIAQEIADSDGSLLHGIMHRREPDYGNSKYWFRRVGRHPSFRSLAIQAVSALGSGHAPLANRLVPGGTWDPFAFIDACESVAQTSANDSIHRVLRELQRAESLAFLERLCLSS